MAFPDLIPKFWSALGLWDLWLLQLWELHELSASNLLYFQKVYNLLTDYVFYQHFWIAIYTDIWLSELICFTENYICIFFCCCQIYKCIIKNPHLILPPTFILSYWQVLMDKHTQSSTEHIRRHALDGMWQVTFHS